MEIAPGEHVTPRVKLVRQLGRGGMGSLWVADHAGLGCEVAVKFLHGDHVADESLRARFAQEAAAASKVKSAHVVKIYDYGITDTGVPYLVMELLEGTDLRRLLDERQRLSPAEALSIIGQLARALERAHDVQVIHRDIKPENVFLSSEGGDWFVKLLDFGVAKTEKTLAQSGAKSTLANETLGTPYYMSPEQFRSAKNLDARSDIWAVGIMTYEMLTGVLPFLADTVGALAIIVNDGQPKPPSEVAPDLPTELDAWFAKACAHEPSERFASVRELVTSLRKAFAKPSDTSGPVVLSTSSRDVIRPRAEPSGDFSLRETAFATTRSASPTSRRYALAAIVAGVAAIAIVVTLRALGGSQTSVEWRPDVAPASSSTPLEHATITAPPESASAIAAQPTPTSSAHHVPAHAAVSVVAAPSASVVPASSGKRKDDVDIY